MNFFKQDLKRIFFSLKIYAGIIVVFLCWIWAINIEFAEGLSQFSNDYLFLAGKDFGIIPLVAPLIAAFPFAASFITDKETGAYRIICTRVSSRKKYISQRLFSNAIAGGTVVFGGCLLVF